MYQINITYENQKHCLTIILEDKLLKKWQGKFAEFIIREIVHKIYNQEGSFLLCKDHTNVFLHHVTMLYRSAIICHDIESSINSLAFSCDKYNIAEVIMMNIRIHDSPLRNNELISILINDFPNHNFLKFYEVIELLVSKKLIEKNNMSTNHVYYCDAVDSYKSPFDLNENKLIDNYKGSKKGESIALV